jgi:hypothetical protein
MTGLAFSKLLDLTDELQRLKESGSDAQCYVYKDNNAWIVASRTISLVKSKAPSFIEQVTDIHTKQIDDTDKFSVIVLVPDIPKGSFDIAKYILLHKIQRELNFYKKAGDSDTVYLNVVNSKLTAEITDMKDTPDSRETLEAVAVLNKPFATGYIMLLKLSLTKLIRGARASTGTPSSKVDKIKDVI